MSKLACQPTIMCLARCQHRAIVQTVTGLSTTGPVRSLLITQASPGQLETIRRRTRACRLGKTCASCACRRCSRGHKPRSLQRTSCCDLTSFPAPHAVPWTSAPDECCWPLYLIRVQVGALPINARRASLMQLSTEHPFRDDAPAGIKNPAGAQRAGLVLYVASRPVGGRTMFSDRIFCRADLPWDR